MSGGFPFPDQLQDLEDVDFATFDTGDAVLWDGAMFVGGPAGGDLTGPPPASATEALLRFGAAPLDLSPQGTWLGGNIGVAESDLIHFESAGDSRFRVEDDGTLTGSAGPLAGSYYRATGWPGPAYGALCNHPDTGVPHTLWPGGYVTNNSGPQFWGAAFDAGTSGTVANMVLSGHLAGGTADSPTPSPAGATSLDLSGRFYDGAEWFVGANIEIRTLGTPSPTNWGSQMEIRTRRENTVDPNPSSFTLFGDQLSIGTGRSSTTTLTAAGYRLNLQGKDLATSQLGLWSLGSASIVTDSRVGGIDVISRDTSVPNAPYPVVASLRAVAGAAHTPTEYSTGWELWTANGTTLARSGKLTAAGQWLVNPGSATAPAYSIFGSEGTGLFSPATNVMGWSTAGVQRLHLTADGKFGIGTATPAQSFTVVRVEDNAAMRLETYHSSASQSTEYKAIRYRGTVALPTTLLSGDRMLRMNCFGYDGTAIREAVNLMMEVDQAPAGGRVPGRLMLSVTAASPLGSRDWRWDSLGNYGHLTTSFGSGAGVIGIANATTVPTTNPTAGGILYCEDGALKFRGSSGTVTVLGVA